MPNSQTILRASSVACSMSLPAPVVIVFEEELLGEASAHHDGELRVEVVARVSVLVVDRQLHGHAQRHAARDDRHLVQRIRVVAQHRHQRVAGFVDTP